MENKGNQQAKKKKRGVKPVPKPHLQGSMDCKVALKRSGKVFLLYVIFMFFFLLLGSALDFESVFLRLLLNGGAIAATVAIMYMEGLRVGDMDVAFGEIAWQRKEAGRDVDKTDLGRCYHPGKGALTALFGALPFVVAALCYAFVAEEQVYALGVLPGWVSTIQAEEITLPLAYYQREMAFGIADVLRIITRVGILPYVNIASVNNTAALLLVDRLSPLCLLLPAVGYVAGYMRGPASRAFTHGSIAAHNRRMKRKKKKEQQNRQRQNKEII